MLIPLAGPHSDLTFRAWLYRTLTTTGTSTDAIDVVINSNNVEIELALVDT